jgi:hypothetical protein
MDTGQYGVVVRENGFVLSHNVKQMDTAGFDSLTDVHVSIVFGYG